MILLIGSDAYSPFRLDAIKDAIAKLDPALGPVEIDAKWVYALKMKDESFPVEELQRAGVLLNAEGECDDADFFVTPRKGTISPWSTKATDIFHNCDLKSIERVERGIRFKTSKKLPENCFAALYDKMTEGVYEELLNSDAAEFGGSNVLNGKKAFSINRKICIKPCVCKRALCEF